MDSFLNAVRPFQVHLLRIDIRIEQPISHGKQHPEIRPCLRNPSQVMHTMIGRRDEEPPSA